jgi:hypothetical protein
MRQLFGAVTSPISAENPALILANPSYSLLKVNEEPGRFIGVVHVPSSLAKSVRHCGHNFIGRLLFGFAGSCRILTRHWAALHVFTRCCEILFGVSTFANGQTAC